MKGKEILARKFWEKLEFNPICTPTKLLEIKFWKGVKYGNLPPEFSPKLSGVIIWQKKIPSGVPWEFYDVIMASYPPNFQDLRGAKFWYSIDHKTSLGSSND